MDCYALGSHQKAIAAIDNDRFAAETVPVTVMGSKGEERSVVIDEAPRRDTSLAALERLAPAFKPDGRVTAGNSPGLNDAAAALVIASGAKAQALGARQQQVFVPVGRQAARHARRQRGAKLIAADAAQL